MKISARWLRQLFPFSVSVQEAAQVLTATGLEVEGVEFVEDVPGGLKGVVVGHVLEVKPHPGADRLQLCQVDLGLDAPVQIVCGARNVAVGQHVPVATVGCTVHPMEGEPFKIKQGKIRGEVSMGMICAEDELSLGQGHDGIMVLEAGLKPGTNLAEVVGMEGDEVIEIGLTPNRNDAMGHWGVARDLRAGLLHGTVEGIGPMAVGELTMPPLASIAEAKSRGCSIGLDVQAGSDCPHYLAVELHNIQVGPSPEPVQRQLRALGLQPINNVVDATNVVLHEFGNPLHAFDLSRIRGGKVVVRKALAGEHLTTLDGVDRTLNEQDLVIADVEGSMCLAGVYGGESSGVHDQTTQVLLEAAWFHPVTVRKTAKRHTLSTDASFRFERGVDPDMVEKAAQRCVQLLQEWAGATCVGAVEHRNQDQTEPSRVELSLTWLHSLLGTTLEQERIRSILASLDIAVIATVDDLWTLEIPAYRSDVTRPADVAEEILRIHGFDHIPLPDRMTGTLEVPEKPDREDVMFGWRELLVNAGYSEIMSNSLTKASYLELVEDADLRPLEAVRMLNPLSTELEVMRQSLVFQGLEAIARNTNHQAADLRLFELGRIYRRIAQDSEHPHPFVEEERLSLWVTGRAVPESWNQAKGKDALSSMYTLKQTVEALFSHVGLRATTRVLASEGLLMEGLEWVNPGGQTIGRMGLVDAHVAKACGVQAPVYWADFSVAALWKATRKRKVKARELPKYPWVRRDLAVVIDKGTTYESLDLAARQAERQCLVDVSLFDVYQGKGLADHEVSYAMSFTLQNPHGTLNDKHIESAMTRILHALESCGARLRQ
jgi:phenylalanyl-tRNA synthetase beta chain